jgi:uncharacterized protein YggE
MSNKISVSGTGTVSAAPDLAMVELGVEVLGQSVAIAREAVATSMQAVIASLRDHGLGDADLSTTGYSINPEYDHRNGRRLRGYRVATTVQARITAIDAVGAIIDDAVAAGGDHIVVRDLRFAHRDQNALAAASRAAAWEDARAKAGQLAELAGLTLGPAVSISEQQGQVPGPLPRMMALEAAGATPIEAGESSVATTIQVEFAIN